MSWLRSTSSRCACLAAILVLGAGTLLAQDGPAKDPAQPGMGEGCAAFKWPLDKERAAFAGAELEKVASGAKRGPLSEQAFALALVPVADVAFAIPPSRKRKGADRPQFGGVVTFAAPEKAGTYQVTLSGEGWIDVVQNGASLHSADHSGAKGCPDLRKSVRFSIGATPVVLQISDAAAETIKISIRPVE